MSDGDWRKHVTPRRIALGIGLLVLVFGCFAWLTHYQHEHRQERDRAAYAGASDTFEERPTTCIHVPLLGAFSCSVSIHDPEQSDAYAKYDLHAQQDMAEWALAIALLTFLGLAVTGVGLRYIIMAYQLNAKATDHARVAAEAATAQAKTANEAFAAERRPWVAVDDVRLTEFQYDSVNGKIDLTVTIILRNAGQSPALDVFLSVGCTGDSNPNTGASLQDAMRKTVKGSKVLSPWLSQTIFPGSPPRPQQWTVSISREDIQKIRDTWQLTFPEGHEASQVLMLLPAVYGIVGYKSAYDTETHTTGFMITYMVDGRGAVQFDPDNPRLPELPRMQGRSMFGGWNAD